MNLMWEVPSSKLFANSLLMIYNSDIYSINYAKRRCSISRGPEVNPSARIAGYRFDSFELKTSSGVLLQNGERVKIQDQPLQILICLLEHPGELVPREVFWKQLWPKKNAEDSDRSLRVAAAKLRQALGDNSIAPRLIETVPRRGYQFIGQFRPIVEQLSGHSSESVSDSVAEAAEPRVKAGATSSNWKRYRSILLRYILPLLVVAGFIADILLNHINRNNVRALSSANLLVVEGVSNLTGERELDGVLSPALRAKLQESPYLNFAAEENFRRLVHDSDEISLKDSLKACSDVHAQEMVGGELLSGKPGYELKLKVWSCANGSVLATQSSQVQSQAEMLAALDAATQHMRGVLGEPQNSLQKFNVPSNQAMTGSLGALKAFTQGEHKHIAGMDSASIEDYKLAVALDSQFALAYARLGAVYSNLVEPTIAQQYYRKAFELRDRTTERERFYITSHYFSSTGEIELAINALQLWREMYPRDSIAAINLANMYTQLGESAKALVQAKAAVQLNPNMDYAYINLVWAELGTGNYARVNELCGSVNEQTSSIAFRVACFQSAFAQNNADGMRAELRRAKGDPAESMMLSNAAWASVYRGQLQAATRLFSAAEENARANRFDEFAAEMSLDQATLEVDVDLPANAKKRALEALRTSPRSSKVQAFAALALARSGDFADADRVAARAAAQAPADTILNDAVLSSARSSEWISQGRADEALKELERARPYDFCSDMELAPAYYRGLAYLQDKQGEKAIGEFRRVIAQRAGFPSSPYVPLSELELGHALMLNGNVAEALRVFDGLAKTWKDADADFAPLKHMNTYRKDLGNR